jgi:hypothetical protein
MSQRIGLAFPALVYVRVSEACKEWLVTKATAEGMTAAAYVRRHLEQAAKADLQRDLLGQGDARVSGVPKGAPPV